jgi:D-glycero-D-manno-heptose 1,7-bisphosphate phosphatase
MHSAIFLDRDGVIIENVDSYVRSWSDVVVFPQALAALSRLKMSSYKIVIVTNQSVVGRGIISLSDSHNINDRLVKVITNAGGRVDGVYVCPHAPEEDCSCRKPRPGLLLQAASALSIDLSQSIFVGDALTDIQAGQNAGIPTNLLVRTGRGAAQIALIEAQHPGLVPIYDNLFDAIDALFTGLLPGVGTG